jgi:hypothetical protein
MFLLLFIFETLLVSTGMGHLQVVIIYYIKKT